MIIIGTDYHPSFQQIAFVLEVPLPQGQGRRHWPRWGAGVSNILTLRKHSDAVVPSMRYQAGRVDPCVLGGGTDPLSGKLAGGRSGCRALHAAFQLS